MGPYVLNAHVHMLSQSTWAGKGVHVQAGLLPVLRKTLRLPRLEYTSIMNQGDFLIEVPSDRNDIPRV